MGSYNESQFPNATTLNILKSRLWSQSRDVIDDDINWRALGTFL